MNLTLFHQLLPPNFSLSHLLNRRLMSAILRFVSDSLQKAISSIYWSGEVLRLISTNNLDPSVDKPAMKNIVILGASYAGISTAHRILKQASKTDQFKVTIVSPNTHFYWNMASPRGVLPGKIDDDQLFKAIAPGFDNYASTQFEFVLGSAESLVPDAKQVHVIESNGRRTIVYDFLILATGSRTADGTPFKMLDTTEKTRDALHGFQQQIKDSKTIVITGGGVTGVEVAGELGFEYGREKKIVLVSEYDLQVTPSKVDTSSMY